LTSSLLSLISSLAEAQEEIIESINKRATFVNFLFGLLGFDLTPSEVQSEVLSCLTALTEDNELLAQQIVDNGDWLRGLLHLKSAKGLVAVGACGPLHNIFSVMQWSDHKTPVPGASDAALLPTLVQTMDTAVSSAGFTNGNASYSTPDQILQLALEITASIATSLQEALEAGHEKEFEGFGDDDLQQDEMDGVADEDGEEANEDEEDEDHEMNDDEIAAEMEMVTGDGPGHDEETSEEPTLEELVRNLTPRVLNLINSNVGSDKETIRAAAISALNNIAWTVSSIDFSARHLDKLREFWSSMAQRIWDETITPVLASDTGDVDYVSSITSLAWAVSRSVQGRIKIQPDEARKFMALYQGSKNFEIAPEKQAIGAKSQQNENSDAFQSLGVKCIGVLGSLALDPAPISLNREVGIFFITTLAALPDTSAAVAVEALNAIFDIYSDSSFAFDEPVFWGDGFYKHLEDILPKAKKLVKTIDKRKFEELRARANDSVLNLTRFLKYKKTEKEKGAK
jgi:hypothetical protein